MRKNLKFSFLIAIIFYFFNIFKISLLTKFLFKNNKKLIILLKKLWKNLVSQAIQFFMKLLP